MAIAIGASTQGTSEGGATSITFSSPSVSGSNTLGIVSTYTEGSDTVSGVTWNGVAMTHIIRDSYGTPSIDLWYIIAPAAGVTNVIATRGGTTNRLYGIATHYTGVAQSSPIDTSISNDTASSGTTFTTTLTVGTANCWLVMCSDDLDSVPSAGTGTTQRQFISNHLSSYDSNGALGTGSRSLVINTTSGDRVHCNLASIKPFIASTTTAGFLLRMI